MMNCPPKSSDKFAVTCQSLYLANLLLLPGIFFLVLFYFYRQYTQLNRANAGLETSAEYNEIRIRNLGIGKIHLIRSLQLSVLAGLLLVVIPLVMIYFSSQLEASIMVGLVYFITLHVGFVLVGMLNLSRAMTKKLPIF
ncbi:hypothetical protein [Colwellia psychrerythraea]|uniref:Uncharacterized protein n=1 Tax=Colwellia psychrerythraea TaxID=28229 RepID=A0A099KIA9_COLPS|nr:hypothetical protein [Colwellia psychrerythraea]KGJ90086.1 hypothetical protein ND2E_3642 [Colwellia psychrerythraea]